MAVSPFESFGCPGPAREDEEREGQSVMAEADHGLACEAVPLGPARQEREVDDSVGHVPYRSSCRACVAGRGAK